MFVLQIMTKPFSPFQLFFFAFVSYFHVNLYLLLSEMNQRKKIILILNVFICSLFQVNSTDVSINSMIEITTYINKSKCYKCLLFASSKLILHVLSSTWAARFEYLLICDAIFRLKTFVYLNDKRIIFQNFFSFSNRKFSIQ